MSTQKDHETGTVSTVGYAFFCTAIHCLRNRIAPNDNPANLEGWSGHYCPLR
jgi:hypothetical protein